MENNIYALVIKAISTNGYHFHIKLIPNFIANIYNQLEYTIKFN